MNCKRHTNVGLFHQPVKDESGHYNTELFTGVAQRIITEHNSSTPLFLYVAHHAVHSGNIQDPLQAPKRLVDVGDSFQYTLVVIKNMIIYPC